MERGKIKILEFTMKLFVQNPIMVGETHHKEDYERGNPDLDPVAESAVYELEKRLDKMEKFDLTGKSEYIFRAPSRPATGQCLVGECFAPIQA